MSGPRDRGPGGYGSLYAEASTLLARYARGVDDGYLEDLGDCFIDAATMTIRFPGGEPVTLHGRTEIVAFIEEFRASPDARGQRRHVFTNVIVDAVSDREAKVSSYLVLTLVRDGAFAAIASGRYQDTLVLEDAGWLIRERQVLMDLAV